jgi:hypothetical protein
MNKEASISKAALLFLAMTVFPAILAFSIAFYMRHEGNIDRIIIWVHFFYSVIYIPFSILYLKKNVIYIFGKKLRLVLWYLYLLYSICMNFFGILIIISFFFFHVFDVGINYGTALFVAFLALIISMVLIPYLGKSAKHPNRENIND